ncbi:tRNA (adenine-N1)-methyltransferase [Thermosipho ferrireducens]|uniref:tRNA (adenine(58)-N(1))-methyltransferase TrmI n=1 Tax=Thermosipho ferrireducens TaxID=2571116 RepID=A0ABX7S5U8_9BACT|nr:tRNA (adenine-N1)-methyltransferase [Thermosipho ferrireducens]QTA37100.1 tRNA (adenine-N1)-methyltransferase [Thermosipho ferrireducens]
MIKEGDKVLLYGEDGSKFIITVEANKKKGTHLGHIDMEELIGKKFGEIIHIGKKRKKFFLLKPTFIDLIFSMKRKTQIIYPKDASYILFKLDVKPGDRIIDTGVGSGAMCGAFARVVGPHGKVYGYEKRKDFYALAQKNLKEWGLLENVEIKLRDIIYGFDEKEVNALLLDVPDPYNYLEKCWEALTGGGKIGIICPTTNQVQETLEKLYELPFVEIEVWENLMRKYKPVPQRLRPVDRMVAHTTYMIFATKVLEKTGGVL